MENNLSNINALEWVTHFENRAMSAINFISITARNFPLERRRDIVKHIKDGSSEAAIHQNIPYAAKELRNDLIHDFWDDFKDGTPTQIQHYKNKIDDFSVVAATNSPTFQPYLKDLIYDIVPEDMPEDERKKRENWKNLMKEYAICDCCC